MAGLEVTPPSPSSSTRRASSPPAMRLRRMKSSQTDWPYCRSAATGLCTAEGREFEVPIDVSPSRAGARLTVARLQRLDLAQAAHVPLLAAEARGHEGAHQLHGEGRTDDPSAQDEHVHVVVLDPLMRRVGVVADRGPDPRQLARRHRGPDAAAADQ